MQRLMLILTAVLTVTSPALAGIRIVTPNQAYADIARAVGGDLVRVDAIMRGPENPHNVVPKPSHMMKLRRAKLFIHSGLDAEPWVPLLIKGARKQEFLPGQTGNVDVSRGIELKEIPKSGELSRALGDIHVFGNPHYILDPLNGIIVAETILHALKRVDPTHAESYQRNFDAYATRLREATRRLLRKIVPYRGTKVVIYHRAWPYFFDRFGLVKVAEVEPKPGITPGPRHLNDCIEKMKAADAKLVVVETFSSKKNAAFVAEKVGGHAVVLALDVRALPQCDTYLNMIEYNVDTLINAMREIGIQPRLAAGGDTKPGDGAKQSETENESSVARSEPQN